MSKLYVAGDSFACISVSQDIGCSWSELLAKELGCELVNLSRPGTSNESISIQIDYVSEKITKDDFLIVFLTDSFRKTFPEPEANLSEKHLLEYHSLHPMQNFIGENIFDSDPALHVYTHLNAVDEFKNYFKTFYNYDYHKYIDTTLLTGALAKLKEKSDNFLVFAGGFDDEVYSKRYSVTARTFLLDDRHFNDLSSSKIMKFTHEPKSINHICYLGHQKIFRYILNLIAEWRRGISSGS